jgi:hypothetical protein
MKWIIGWLNAKRTESPLRTRLLKPQFAKELPLTLKIFGIKGISDIKECLLVIGVCLTVYKKGPI